MADKKKNVVYGTVQVSSAAEIKGMFTIEGPHQNVVYIAKSCVYFGTMSNNSFEGHGVYYDLDQYFTYIGPFHLSMKEGLGIVMQYGKGNFEYMSPQDITSEKMFTTYAGMMQGLLAKQISTWRKTWEDWQTTLSSTEELVAGLAAKFDERTAESLHELCQKLQYQELKKLQPPQTASCFVGELKADTREGTGITFCKNGDIYIGNYSKNKRNGFGIYLWKPNPGASSLVYIGYHSNNLFTKFAAVLMANQDFYVGQIANNAIAGKGVCIGHGKTWTFNGEFKQGKRTGVGRFVHQAEEWSYTGDFVNDTLEGIGTQVWTLPEDHVEYKGGFKGGFKSGACLITTHAHAVYEGDITVRC